MRILFAGSVCEVAQIPPQTLKEWAMKGIISPHNDGKGTGNHRVYSLMDAIAIAYAYGWRRCGLSLELTREVVNAVLEFADEKDLRAALNKGRRFAMILPGATRLTRVPVDLLAPGEKLPEALDLEVVFRQVMKRVEELETAEAV